MHFFLHLHTYVMLRYAFFSCTCPHTSCYAMLYALAVAHIRHATLCFLLLQLPTYDHIRHATLCFLLLQLPTYVMLRYVFFSCSCPHTYSFLFLVVFLPGFARALSMTKVQRCSQSSDFPSCFDLAIFQSMSRTSTSQTIANHPKLETTDGKKS